MILPVEAQALLAVLLPHFTQPTATRFVTLLVAAVLTQGRRTVANLLRTLGPLARGHRTTYQRVLSRAPWSTAALGTAFAGFLLRHLLPDGPVVLVGALTHGFCYRGRAVASRWCYPPRRPTMPAILSSPVRRELLTALRTRYHHATREEKTRILDEYVAVAGCHRKSAVRLLVAVPTTDPGGQATDTPSHGRRIYADAVCEAVVVLWEAADRICGKRLKCLIPNLLDALERHRHVSLDPAVRELVLRASAATLDRLLATARSRSHRRKRRKAATKPSREIPIRTFADWDDTAPGFLEMDFVSHGGTSMRGVFLWSLVATDVASGWTEMVPLVAREQSLVVERLNALRRQFPMPVRGIDTDNDGAFINETLQAYCVREGLVFTRSRAYRKNDQAWIEQKNGAVVRRFVGHERFAGLIAGQCLARLYESVRRYVNFFQPSFQLKSKVRIGAKVRKSYHPPATPCDRLLAHASVLGPVKESLRESRGSLDPLALLHRIREGQSAPAGMRSGEFGSATSTPRSYRTRKDPFEGVWAEILGWFQKEPDATAKVLMDRLQEQFPGRFPDGQLRTLQRRIRDWRRVIAKTLVGHGLGSGPAAELPVIGAGRAG